MNYGEIFVLVDSKKTENISFVFDSRMHFTYYKRSFKTHKRHWLSTIKQKW